MYYKIKDNTLFRQYDDYGYITDNSMFGYRTFNDDFLYPGEEYVSIDPVYEFDVSAPPE